MEIMDEKQISFLRKISFNTLDRVWMVPQLQQRDFWGLEVPGEFWGKNIWRQAKVNHS